MSDVRRGRRLGATASPLVWMILAGLSVSTLYPLAFLVATSLKTPLEYAGNPLGLPPHPTLDAFQAALADGRVIALAVNSTIVVVGGVVVILAVSSLAAFALAHLYVPQRRLVLLSIVGLMFLPASVQVLPIFLTVRQIGLLNSYPGLILTYAALQAPFAVYLLTAFLRGIPRELFEAAECDGASVIRAYWSVAMPLARPALLALAVLNFLWLWNDLLFSLLILQGDKQRTLTVGLASILGQYPEVPLQAAIALISLLPALVVFFVFQRSLAQGLTAAAIK